MGKDGYWPISMRDAIQELEDNITQNKLLKTFNDLNSADEKANELFEKGNYQAAAEAYSQNLQNAQAALDQFKDFKPRYPTRIMIFTIRNGITSSSSVPGEIADITKLITDTQRNWDNAKHNIEAQRHNAGLSSSINSESNQPSLGAVGDASEQVESQIQSLKTDATTAFNNQDYENAAHGFKQIIDLIQKSKNQTQYSSELTAAHHNLDASLYDLLNNVMRDYNKTVQTPNQNAENIQSSMNTILDELKDMEHRFPEMGDKPRAQIETIRKAVNGVLDQIKNRGDQASIVPVGGIDFNSVNLNLQIQGDAGQMVMFVDPKAWANVKLLGLIPSIIQIKTVSNWGTF